MRDATERVKIIKRRVKEAHEKQKSYTDSNRYHVEFAKADLLYVKISIMKGVMRVSRAR